MPVAATLNGLTLRRAEPASPPRPHPVLFIHGMWEGTWLWEGFLDAFAARGYAGTALNLRGYHGSRPVQAVGRVSLHDYIADAREVAEALGRPILVGHSMGGLLTQKLAEALDPPAAVLLAPAAPRGFLAVRTPRILGLAVRHLPQILAFRPVPLSRAEADGLLLNGFPPEERGAVFERFVPASGRQTLEVATLSLPVEAQRVRCPVLVLGGTQDRITPAPLLRKIAATYDAPYREYAEHAHLLPVEPGWERLAADVLDWLDTVLPPAEG